MQNHRIRGLLFLYEKNCYLAIGFCFFGKSIQKYPDSVCENDVNNEQNVRAYYMQTIKWEVNYSTAKKVLFWLLFSILFSSAGSSSSAIVAPFASAGIRPVVDRLNQDTTL